MSNTTHYRYEVSHKDYGVIEHVMTLRQAIETAERWMDSEKTDYANKTVTIYDRMHSKNWDGLYTVSICTGEAHSNAFIDNCAVCMPRWGFVVRPYPHAILRQYA